MRTLLALYPRAWRHRCGSEFTALLDEQGASPSVVLDTVLGAIDAHLDPQLADDGEPSLRRRMKDVVMKSLRWFTFITCAVAVSGGVLILGIIAPRRELVALGLVPVLYFVAVIAVKLALGWWITDETLQAIGEWSAAATIGGGWMVLGLVLLRRSRRLATRGTA